MEWVWEKKVPWDREDFSKLRGEGRLKVLRRIVSLVGSLS